MPPKITKSKEKGQRKQEEEAEQREDEFPLIPGPDPLPDAYSKCTNYVLCHNYSSGDFSKSSEV